MKRTLSIVIVLAVMAAAAGYVFFGGFDPKPETVTDTRKPPVVGSEKSEGPKFRIIAVGDSLTAGYDLPLSESYPEILEKKLMEAGADVEVVNAGVSGETTAGLLERAGFISGQKPDLLLITIGGNDAFRNLPLKNTKENITEALRIFKRSVRAQDIYLLRIEAVANAGLGYRKEFNGMYEEIAEAEGVNVLPFVVKEVFLDPKRMLPDGIHPNRIGYEFIVDTYIFPEIVEKVKR
jgi:acyl-CoA thioesterase-1